MADLSGDKNAVIVISWLYEEGRQAGFDGIMRAIRQVLPNDVHVFAAIEQTAQNILAQFEEDEH